MAADDAAAVMLSVADVTEVFIELSAALRGIPGAEVTHLTWIRRAGRASQDHYSIGTGSGFLVEWWAEAELRDGRNVVFYQEVSWDQGEWIVAAAVRSTKGATEEALVELPTRYATDSEDAARQMRGQAALLLNRHSEVIRRLR